MKNKASGNGHTANVETFIQVNHLNFSKNNKSP